MPADSLAAQELQRLALAAAEKHRVSLRRKELRARARPRKTRLRAKTHRRVFAIPRFQSSRTSRRSPRMRCLVARNPIRARECISVFRGPQAAMVRIGGVKNWTIETPRAKAYRFIDAVFPGLDDAKTSLVFRVDAPRFSAGSIALCAMRQRRKK